MRNSPLVFDVLWRRIWVANSTNRSGLVGQHDPQYAHWIGATAMAESLAEA
jgi:hypothetical protein